MRILAVIDNGIARFEAFVLAFGVLVMAANSIANVVGRFVFSQSIYFTEELNQFLIVLVTFVGLGYAARKGRHIRMSAVYDQLTDRQRKAMMILIAGVTAAVMFVLAYYSYVYVARVAKLGKVTPSMQIPLYLTYLWVPLGFVITGIQYILTVVKNLRSDDVYISYEQIDSYDEGEGIESPSELAAETAADGAN
jgi:TRAP-type C4-dicarboxylate transport system permease small subunit